MTKATPLSMRSTRTLEDEYIQMHRHPRTARTEAARAHCARLKLEIEKELSARKCAKPL